MNYRDERLLELDTLSSALEAAKLPPALEAARKSAMKKIAAQKTAEHALYIDNDDIRQDPSMGLVEIEHLSLDERVHLFNGDIPTANIVRITLHQAAQRKSTGAVIAQEKIAQVVMSEVQFGDILIHQNARGSAVTIEYLHGPVTAYDRSKDLSAKKIDKLKSDVVDGPSEQTERFTQELRDALENAAKSGKIGKNDMADLLRTVNMLSTHAISNNTFYLKQIIEAISARQSIAMLDIHFQLANVEQLTHKD